MEELIPLDNAQLATERFERGVDALLGVSKLWYTAIETLTKAIEYLRSSKESQ